MPSPSPGESFASAWTHWPGALRKLGLKRGDTIALMLSNRPEFHLCDLAAMMLGATPFSIYNTYAPAQIAYLVSDADTRVLICEQQYLAEVLEARKELPNLEHVIVVDGEAPEGTLALSDVEGSNPEFDVEASVAQIQPTDVLTLIYTSGTTGPPKGVQLIHRNLLAAVEGFEELIELPAGRSRYLVASRRTHRRAKRASLPAGRVRSGDHLLRRSAPGPLLSAGSAPELVLRRSAHLGEAQGGAGDDGRRAARGAARLDTERAGRERAQGAPRAARRRGSRRACRAGRPGRRRDLRGPSPDARARTAWRRSTSAPRPLRSRFWSSSTRSGCRSPSCGA